MNNKQKVVLSILIICIIFLIVLMILSSVSYSNINLNNNKVTGIINTNTVKKTTTKENNIEDLTTITENTSKVTTRKTTIKSNYNNEENSNKGVQNETLQETYYYKWSEVGERDYTGRNCLFIYDKDGKLVEGEAILLYYGKYRKTQSISKDVDNCFLEDMYSTNVESIIVKGIEYEQ